MDDLPAGSSPTAVQRPLTVLVGGYTAEAGGGGRGFESWSAGFDDAGALQAAPAAGLPLASPSYLVPHPRQPWLLAVSETDPGRLTSLRYDRQHPPAVLSSVAVSGSGPCHLAVSPDGGQVVVADYPSGSVSSFSIRPDGTLSDERDRMQLTGSGPDQERQQGPHAHQVVFDGPELLVCDLGTDRVHRLRLDASGRLTQAADPLQLPGGTGPRHLVLAHDHLVLATELSARLLLLRRVPAGWELVDDVPASASVEGPVHPSAVVARDRRVWVANRGPDTVAGFDLDPVADRLSRVTELGCGGAEPRDLAVTADHLWVANQRSDRVSVFSTSPSTGAAAPQQIVTPSPACVVVLDQGSARPR